MLKMTVKTIILTMATRLHRLYKTDGTIVDVLVDPTDDKAPAEAIGIGRHIFVEHKLLRAKPYKDKLLLYVTAIVDEGARCKKPRPAKNPFIPRYLGDVLIRVHIGPNEFDSMFDEDKWSKDAWKTLDYTDVFTSSQLDSIIG